MRLTNPAIMSSAFVLVLSACASAPKVVQSQALTETVSSTELQFQPLNPARGDAAPQAGVLWGGIKEDVPSGVLLKFADGFSSPPHIHNITYRAVVISGAVHNDDPDAEDMWMGPGSFWTQPAGEPHITAGAEGSGATAFLEILKGPYLVQPTEQSFDNGDRPVNLDARNVVWLDASDITWFDVGGAGETAKGAKMAFLWGDAARGEKSGTFLKLAENEQVSVQGNGAWLRAIVIKGQISHRSGDGETRTLVTGSYFGSKGGQNHEITCATGSDCTFYVSTEGRYRVSTTSNNQ